MEDTLNRIAENLSVRKKDNETLVLFLNDNNGWSHDNPIADLVLVENYDHDLIKSKEMKIPGVYQQGGNWKHAVSDAGLNFKEIISGRGSDFTKGDIVNYIKERYYVISGNY